MMGTWKKQLTHAKNPEAFRNACKLAFAQNVDKVETLHQIKLIASRNVTLQGFFDNASMLSIIAAHSGSEAALVEQYNSLPPDRQKEELSRAFIYLIQSFDSNHNCWRAGITKWKRPTMVTTRWVLDKDVDLNMDVEDAPLGMSALIAAVNIDLNPDLIMALLDHKGTDLNYVDARGNTAMHYLAAYQRPNTNLIPMLKQVLIRRPNLGITNLDGNTPLAVAANGDIERVYYWIARERPSEPIWYSAEQYYIDLDNYLNPNNVQKPLRVPSIARCKFYQEGIYKDYTLSQEAAMVCWTNKMDTLVKGIPRKTMNVSWQSGRHAYRTLCYNWYFSNNANWSTGIGSGSYQKKLKLIDTNAPQNFSALHACLPCLPENPNKLTHETLRHIQSWHTGEVPSWYTGPLWVNDNIHTITGHVHPQDDSPYVQASIKQLSLDVCKALSGDNAHTTKRLMETFCFLVYDSGDWTSTDAYTTIDSQKPFKPMDPLPNGVAIVQQYAHSIQCWRDALDECCVEVDQSVVVSRYTSRDAPGKMGVRSTCVASTSELTRVRNNFSGTRYDFRLFKGVKVIPAIFMYSEFPKELEMAVVDAVYDEREDSNEDDAGEKRLVNVRNQGRIPPGSGVLKPMFLRF